MTYDIYLIYDRVSNQFGEPFFAVSQGVAVRRFNYMMSNAPMVAKDCDLYLYGYYNSETGEITCCNQLGKPTYVCCYEVPLSE